MPAFDSNAFDIAFEEVSSLSVGIFGFFNDPFDSLMNNVADILENQGATDGYGQRSDQVRTFATIATVPCFVSTDAPGRPHEFKVEKKSSLDYSRVFMRVPTLPGGVELNTHHWLKIDGDFYDVFNVLNPGGLDHHLEVVCQIVTP